MATITECHTGAIRLYFLVKGFMYALSGIGLVQDVA